MLCYKFHWAHIHRPISNDTLPTKFQAQLITLSLSPSLGAQQLACLPYLCLALGEDWKCNKLCEDGLQTIIYDRDVTSDQVLLLKMKREPRDPLPILTTSSRKLTASLTLLVPPYCAWKEPSFTVGAVNSTSTHFLSSTVNLPAMHNIEINYGLSFLSTSLRASEKDITFCLGTHRMTIRNRFYVDISK